MKRLLAVACSIVGIGLAWAEMTTAAALIDQQLINDGLQASQGVDLGNSPVFSSPRLTLSMCVKLTDLDRDQVLLEKFEWRNSGYYVKYEKTAGLYAEIFDGSDQRRMAVFGPIKPDKWYNICFVVDGKKLVTYKNGLEVDACYADDIIHNDLPLTIPPDRQGLEIMDLQILDKPFSITEYRNFLARYTITKHHDFIPENHIDVLSIPTEALYKGSILNHGNLARIQAVLAKARRGENIIVGTIGGSITMGALATAPENRWANRVAKWFCDTYPDITVQLYNAGIGATDSKFGVLRAKSHLLKYQPDIVIVEYAINDSINDIAGETLEGLLRQTLKSQKQPAVILLAMMNEFGDNVQDKHIPLAEHYGIPMVSFKNVCAPLLAQGRIAADQILADSVHPNDAGHELAARLVNSVLDRAGDSFESKTKIKTSLPAPLYTDMFEHVTFIEAGQLTPTATDGWTLAAHAATSGSPWDMNGRRIIEKVWTASRPQSVLEFEYEGTFLALTFWKEKADMGSTDVVIDGQERATLNGWGPQTWGGYATTTVIRDSLPFDKHHVRIRIDTKKQQESNGHQFDLIAVAYGAGNSNSRGPQ